MVCASSEYIRQHGEPEQPIDLLSHNCVRFNYSRSNRFWTFHKKGGVEKLRVRGNLRANNSTTLKAAVEEGVGVGLLPVWLIRDDLQSGWQVAPSTPGDIHAVYLPSRRGSAKVRVFIDFLLSELRPLLDWSPVDQGRTPTSHQVSFRRHDPGGSPNRAEKTRLKWE